MCACLSVCAPRAHMWPKRPEDGTGFPRTGVLCSCELPDVDART